jgi:hypothetical protein
MNILKITSPSRKWYEIMLWWELRRIPYNIILAGVGYASFYIGYVSIPIVYLVIGILLNVGYGVLWILEIVIHDWMSDRNKIRFARVAFLSYLAISILTVLAFSLLIFLPD